MVVAISQQPAGGMAATESPAAKYNQFGGKHSETAAIKNILSYYGVVAPHSGQPYTEEMLLGIGGGIGANYWVFEMKQGPILILSTRHVWETYTNFTEKICRRVGGVAVYKETGSAKIAEANLKQALSEGHPVATWVDLASLPYRFLPESLVKYMVHVVVVVGLDESRDKVLVDDIAAAPFTLTREQLAAARSAIGSNKNRIMVFEPPKQAPDLEAAIVEGIRDCIQGLRDERISNFGITALPKWADLVANTKDKKGWPNVFPRGLHLYKALVSTFQWIETNGTGGSAFRTMYADFLEEAAGVGAGKPQLKEIAGQYREAAKLWSGLASAALPDSAKLFRDAKELLLRKSSVFKKGASALDEISETASALRALETEAAEAFPLSEVQTEELLADLRSRIQEIYNAEVEALGALERVVS
jgi:hypothetical protein